MLKYIKHHVDSIVGIEIYPIISLLLFFLVFTVMLIYAFRIPKESIEEKSSLPLDND
ncbi:MAG: CcoQ/FixQ family Cbb3-type cytochrome c oxidase assembly chaperone [Lutimonas sp.]|jgi:hypothetical protein